MDAIPIPEAMKPYMPLAKGILIAIAILVVGWMVSKWASRLTRRTFSHRKLDQALAGFVASMVQYALLAVAVITALGAVGLQTTSLVAVFASAGLAVGLALQGSLGNFASGVMILLFAPSTSETRSPRRRTRAWFQTSSSSRRRSSPATTRPSSSRTAP